MNNISSQSQPQPVNVPTVKIGNMHVGIHSSETGTRAAVHVNGRTFRIIDKETGQEVNWGNRSHKEIASIAHAVMSRAMTNSSRAETQSQSLNLPGQPKKVSSQRDRPIVNLSITENKKQLKDQISTSFDNCKKAVKAHADDTIKNHGTADDPHPISHASAFMEDMMKEIPTPPTAKNLKALQTLADSNSTTSEVKAAVKKTISLLKNMESLENKERSIENLKEMVNSKINEILNNQESQLEQLQKDGFQHLYNPKHAEDAVKDLKDLRTKLSNTSNLSNKDVTLYKMELYLLGLKRFANSFL